MAFGISGSITSTDMIGADVIVAWMSHGHAHAVDYLLTARQQVSTRWDHHHYIAPNFCICFSNSKHKELNIGAMGSYG